MKSVVRAAVAMLFIAILSVPLLAQQPAAKSNFAATTQEREKGEGREHHPHIRSAIRELQDAKRELQTAAHDFGGHRVEALRACDEAIHQLQLALQYDKK